MSYNLLRHYKVGRRLFKVKTNKVRMIWNSLLVIIITTMLTNKMTTMNHHNNKTTQHSFQTNKVNFSNWDNIMRYYLLHWLILLLRIIRARLILEIDKIYLHNKDVRDCVICIWGFWLNWRKMRRINLLNIF